jgi:hypothetical protein
MPEQQRPKKSQDEETNKNKPERHEIEAEIPSAPAKEPVAEPEPIGGTRGPRPQIEREIE